METTVEPTAAPEETVAPAVESTAEPTVTPAAEETAEPAVEPTVEPTTEPTVEPTAEPTMVPEETVEETTEPTATPAADKYAYYVYNQYYDVAGNQVGSNVTVKEDYENTAATVDVTFDTIITYEAKQYKAKLLEGETEVEGKVTRNVTLTANEENYIYVIEYFMPEGYSNTNHDRRVFNSSIKASIYLNMRGYTERVEDDTYERVYLIPKGDNENIIAHRGARVLKLELSE